MESYEALLGTLALTMGASWASGINLYAVLLVLGIGGSTGNIALPTELQVLTDPMVIGAAGLMYFVEFFIDKTPGVDTAWDTLHTFIRIPAGAMLAAGAVGDVTPALAIAAGVMGGSLSAVSHATKAGSRALINTSPEPFSNWGASITEDLVVLGGLWTALSHPLIFLCLLLLFLIFAVWMLPKIWRLLKTVVIKIGSFLGLINPEEKSSEAPPETDIKTTPNASKEQTSSKEEQLQALETLKHSGCMTDEEFTLNRQKILGQ